MFQPPMEVLSQYLPDAASVSPVLVTKKAKSVLYQTSKAAYTGEMRPHTLSVLFKC